ncbi:MAG: hypothetical protein HY549_01285 [Elusimicrobia bacterium]|nr:hypothetical protein [Elusimicrobiota bacterium]
MSEWDNFEKWAALARKEEPPRTDVARAVLYRLKQPARVENVSDGIWAFSTASACAALVCAIVGYNSWLSLLGDYYGWMHDFASWNLP